MEQPKKSAPKKKIAPLVPPLGADADTATPAVVPLGENLTPLEPVESIPKPLRDPTKRLKNDTQEAARVALLAKDQFPTAGCVLTQAKIVGVDGDKMAQFRVNFLGVDGGKPTKPGEVAAAVIVTTHKQLDSKLIRVDYKKDGLVLTDITQRAKVKSIFA
jgi:hypothetical protein